ncbi:hypothetical protein FACS189490_01580 [Clostridia bacterium]|nr:hypothetical protein FACS189490_01580 [Clostridia bacterium]
MLNDFFGSASGKAVSALLALIFIIAVAGVFRRKFSAKTLTYAAACIALAMVLSYIKVNFPQGGSITLCSMLFISLIGFFFGPAVGIIGGAAYGFLQLAIDPYVVHPAQLFLDYPIAFAMLGASGFFTKSNRLKTGFVIGALLRGAVSTISGMIFFAEYAAVGQSVFVYSVTYNFGYILPETILTIVILSIPAVISAIIKVKNDLPAQA